MQFHALCRWKHDTTGRIPFFYLRRQEYEQDNVDLLQSSCSGGRRSDLWDRTAYLKANSWSSSLRQFPATQKEQGNP